MVTVLLEILDDCWQNYVLYYVTLYYIILITPYLIVSFCRFLNCIKRAITCMLHKNLLLPSLPTIIKV